MYEEIDEEKVYEEFEKALEEAIGIYQSVENISYPQLNIFIEERVWESIIKYNRMELTTKEKFFENLYKGTSVDEYTKGIYELWGNIDHTYMDKAIKELQRMVVQKDFRDAEMYGNRQITTRSIKLQNSWRNYDMTKQEYYELNPERDFKTIEQRYINRHIKLYANTLKRYANSKDLAKDLSNFMKVYDKVDKQIPYYAHEDIYRNEKLICKGGDILRYVDVSTYNSMLYNVNLTRSAWNRSFYDAKLLGNDLWYLPAHPFACPSCAYYQGKVYTNNPNNTMFPQMKNAIEGGVGHPNCKHVWVSYWSSEQIQEDRYNSSEWDEKYKTKQKIQSLDLQKSRLLADRRIYNNLGQQDLVDKTTKKITKLRSKVNELKALL